MKKKENFQFPRAHSGLSREGKRILLNQIVCSREESLIVNWLTFEYAFQCKSLLIVHLQNVSSLFSKDRSNIILLFGKKACVRVRCSSDDVNYKFCIICPEKSRKLELQKFVTKLVHSLIEGPLEKYSMQNMRKSADKNDNGKSPNGIELEMNFQ